VEVYGVAITPAFRITTSYFKGSLTTVFAALLTEARSVKSISIIFIFGILDLTISVFFRSLAVIVTSAPLLESTLAA
jgi:hypothetical protein